MSSLLRVYVSSVGATNRIAFKNVVFFDVTSLLALSRADGKSNVDSVVINLFLLLACSVANCGDHGTLYSSMAPLTFDNSSNMGQ